MTFTNQSLTEPIREEIVDYKNALMYLKIWEIHALPPDSGEETVGPWHYHKEVEFLAVVEGKMGVQTKDEHYALEYGDLILLGSSQLHRTFKSAYTPVKFIVFQVDLHRHFERSALPYLHGFTELSGPLGRLNYVFQQNPTVRQLAFELILEIYQESLQQERGYELAIGAAIQRLLGLLIRHDHLGLLHTIEARELARIRPVLDYVEHHLHEKITVEEACKILNFSYHYFIRYFRATMGCSFIEYVNRKRIKKAERMLLTVDSSIADIAIESGMASTAQFYKLFKRYNDCSPKEFMAQMGEETKLYDRTFIT